ncbi:hypothetical protein [Shewanella chilikensis]|uniref:hypothetical protein n=1 Tax=Shewanella chilikensis TaxID=558541 RepID=UPI003A980386
MNKQPTLEQLIEQLPREKTPERDLWPEIAARLEQSQPPKAAKSSNGWRNQAIACSLLLVFLLGYQGLQQPQSRVDPQMLAMLEQLQYQHQQQVKQLEASVNFGQWQKVSMTTPLSRGIDELREAATQIFQALKQDPTDQQLWQLWLWVQQREIELLTRGEQLPTQLDQQGISI